MPRPMFIRIALAFIGALLLANSAWAAPKYKVLHAFGSGNDGAGLSGQSGARREGQCIRHNQWGRSPWARYCL